MDLLDCPGDHSGNQLFLVGLRHAFGRDQRSVAQNGDPIGQLKDFFQPVGNIDDGDSLRLQAPNQCKELRGLLGASDTPSLRIEDQEARAAGGGTRGSHQLLLADGQRGEERRRPRQLKADIIGGFFDLLESFRALGESQSALSRRPEKCLRQP